MTAGTIEQIRPQKGYQMKALASMADIVIGGAAAGVGKTFCLLLDPLKHITTVPGFGGVVFRRTTTQVKNEGGLWDTSMSLYSKVPQARPRESSLEWLFEVDAHRVNKIKFAHLEHEKNVLDWQGAQIAFIGFDELTHFTEHMFFYLLSRNRSVCGIRPYVRATCNPDPESWVFKLIEWWIGEDGFPIAERNGKVRYFTKKGNTYIWGSSIDEVYEQAKFFLEDIIRESALQKAHFIKSISFVSGSIYDNKKLLEHDPSYLGNLLAQDEQTQLQLFKGNWKFVPSDLDIYRYQDFLGVFNNLYQTRNADKYITADIALEGSNKFVVGYWEGKSLEDLVIIDKSKGNEVIDTIVQLAQQYKVPNTNIVFDSDGVGGFVDGFIIGAMPFHGGGAVMPVKDAISGRIIREDYFNLKTQLYYRSGYAVSKGDYRISEQVAIQMYDDRMTVRQRFMYERKAIKKDKVDSDGRKRIIPKEQMKLMLNNQSPDLMDMFMMRELFELKPRYDLGVY
ncbi:terminase large subunit domain-containing protein [Emticicia fontis]